MGVGDILRRFRRDTSAGGKSSETGGGGGTSKRSEDGRSGAAATTDWTVVANELSRASDHLDAAAAAIRCRSADRTLERDLRVLADETLYLRAQVHALEIRARPEATRRAQVADAPTEDGQRQADGREHKNGPQSADAPTEDGQRQADGREHKNGPQSADAPTEDGQRQADGREHKIGPQSDGATGTDVDETTQRARDT